MLKLLMNLCKLMPLPDKINEIFFKNLQSFSTSIMNT